MLNTLKNVKYYSPIVNTEYNMPIRRPYNLYTVYFINPAIISIKRTNLI